jgi:GTP-binding protein Era
MARKKKSKYRSGFVTFIGRANTGKSTLLNALMGRKISIISPVPQTTRYVTRGILTRPDAQIVFVDTPGMHLTSHRLAGELNRMASTQMEGVDLIVYVVDTSRKPYAEEEHIMDLLVKQELPVIMVLNKIDKSRRCEGDYVDMWNAKAGGLGPLKYFIPVSAAKQENLDALLSAIIEFIPEGPALYEPETKTDFPLQFRLADIIREKACLLLKEEVPHHCAVVIDEMNEEDDGLMHINASIIMTRESQKHIVVGPKGATIREIGIQARRDINTILNRKTFLDLKVKVVKDWQENVRIIRELGYSE